MTDYAKANVSTKQPTSGEDARIPGPHGDQKRPTGAEEAPGQRAEAPDPKPLLSLGARFPKSARLRNSGEFKVTYQLGKRYDGRMMTAFVLRNELGRHRIGITASRKMAKSAVERNRAKRLLREAFRLSSVELAGLPSTYDWVLNARRSLLSVKLGPVLEEFRQLVVRVSRDATVQSAGANQET